MVSTLHLHVGDILRGELVGILGALRDEQDGENTQVAQTNLLALLLCLIDA